MQRRGVRPDQAVEARVSEVIARHERSLMRVAQHWSLCRDDALDAYQRALEIYVRRLDSLDPATEISWLKVVVKHEALAVRRQRAESVPVEDADLDGHAADAQRPVDDLLAGRERVERSAEALRRLKPDEAKALMLKAQGHSYHEIGEALGWTYTKVNRCITEGRARFLKVYAEIEAGEECARFAPTLAALVGGTASADALLELRPHIRNCSACRATVRELHATQLGRLAALWPVPALVAPLRWVSGRFRNGDVQEEFAGVADVYERIELPGQTRSRLVDWSLQRGSEAVTSLKQHAVSAYSRAVDPTPLAGVRPGAAAAAVAGCLALGGGTTYCVTKDVDPIGGLANVVAPAPERKQVEPRRERRAPKRAVASAELTPAPTPQDEYEPVTAATAASTAPRSSSPTRKPASAPADGPGEFDGP